MRRPGRVDDLAAGRLVEGHPGVRKPALGQRLLWGGGPGLVVADEEVAGVVVAAACVIVATRDVPDAFVFAPGDRQVLLAALTAEVRRDEDAVRAVRAGAGAAGAATW